MLRISIHAGPLAGISRFNRVDWVDIGYDKLAASANYKIVLFNVGEGATPPVDLIGYPRWSASLWDLAARAIALALSPDPKNPQETVPAVEKRKKRYAFAYAMSAVIQHFPNSGMGIRRVGEMDIEQCRATRGFYRAQVEEDLMPNSSGEFSFFPNFLRPAELVMRAALVALTGRMDEMPARPALVLPQAQKIEGEQHLLIHEIDEPARTGFIRWLYDNETPPREYAGAAEGIALERQFYGFLHEAI
jgi:hypothetical protein